MRWPTPSLGQHYRIFWCVKRWQKWQRRLTPKSSCYGITGRKKSRRNTGSLELQSHATRIQRTARPLAHDMGIAEMYTEQPPTHHAPSLPAHNTAAAIFPLPTYPPPTHTQHSQPSVAQNVDPKSALEVDCDLEAQHHHHNQYDEQQEDEQLRLAAGRLAHDHAQPALRRTQARGGDTHIFVQLP